MDHFSCNNYSNKYTRRDFLTKTSLGLGAISIASLLNPLGLFGNERKAKEILEASTGGVLGQPHFLPRAKRVIYLFQSGGPSHLDLFDYKPTLNKLNGDELPPSAREGQRLTGMTSGQNSFPLPGLSFHLNNMEIQEPG